MHNRDAFCTIKMRNPCIFQCTWSGAQLLPSHDPFLQVRAKPNYGYYTIISWYKKSESRQAGNFLFTDVKVESSAVHIRRSTNLLTVSALDAWRPFFSKLFAGCSTPVDFPIQSYRSRSLHQESAALGSSEKYGIYGRRAPLMRNILIVENCDFLLAFWNGRSRGTKFTLDYAEQ